MATIFAPPYFTAQDAAGRPILNASLTFYASGTLDEATVYSDALGLFPLPSPIVTDGAGRAPTIYLDDAVSYRLIVLNAAGITVRDVDPVNSLGVDLTNGIGATLIGFLRGVGGVVRTIADVLINGLPTSVLDYGTGTDPGARINACIAAGATNIVVPSATNWVWTTTATLPDGWRGKIRHSSDGTDGTDGTDATSIKARTGVNYPCIDMQGAAFVTIEGFNVFADGVSGSGCAAFLVIARMPSGASSGNHDIARNLVRGVFANAVVYNVGGEELNFSNNYWAIYGSPGAGDYRRACVVHTLNEESYFSNIVTKAARTNGSSTSAIRHTGDVIKQQNALPGSGVYIGPNVNDIDINPTYGYCDPAGSAFLTLGGAFDGIRMNAGRVELTKATRLVYAPVDASSGSISLTGGAYRRSGAVDSTKYLIDITGANTSPVTINIDKACSFTANGTDVEDIYLVRSTRKTTASIDVSGGGPVATLFSSRVTIDTLVASSIAIGQRAFLSVTTYLLANTLRFFGDTADAAEFRGGLVARNGAKVFGAPLSITPIFGTSEGMNSTSNSTSSSIHAYFVNPNGIVGSITTLASATAFNTSSDVRLKANIADAPAAGAIIDLLRPRSFDWIVDGSHVAHGFIAQELAAVVPLAVHVGGSNPETDPWGVDHSALVPLLVTEIKSVRARLAALEVKP